MICLQPTSPFSSLSAAFLRNTAEHRPKVVVIVVIVVVVVLMEIPETERSRAWDQASFEKEGRWAWLAATIA